MIRHTAYLVIVKMVLPGSSAVTNNSTPANRSAPDNASLARPFASTSTLIQAAAVAATMLLGVAL